VHVGDVLLADAVALVFDPVHRLAGVQGEDA
jgi:hypothetical protein